jgi:uncharacterized protein YndB with AHSA1/START domain
MKDQPLEIRTNIQITKPPSEVFEAIIDPSKMSNYFISRASGRMEEGKSLTWWFPEFEDGFPVRIGRIEQDKYISYYWEVEGKELLVEMNLLPKPNNNTLVTITEKEMNNNEAGIKWLKGNTEGWANFLACLKAWLEYGINLRKGAFDFLKNENAPS